MKKREIIFLTPFKSVHLYKTTFELFIKEVCNNFHNVYFVNIDNLVESKKTKNYNKKLFLNLPKKIIFYNPINFNSLDLFLREKKPIMINNTGREFRYYRLFFYLKKKNIPQIMINHVGNLQASAFYHMDKDMYYLKWLLTKILPEKLFTILSSLGFVPKFDIRFTCNREFYRHFINNKKNFFRRPSAYKEFFLVKSKQFDEKYYLNKTNVKEDVILLIDQEPEYDDFEQKSRFKKELIEEHYRELNQLLNNFSKVFKKQVIISIHPAYDLNRAARRFKKFKVVKFKTKDLIKKSFIVLFFDSSAIVDAIVLKKRIICIRSNLFKESKHHKSDLYREKLNLKTINLSKKTIFHPIKFIKDLDSRFKYYDKYLRKYTSSNIQISGNKSIVREIKSRYF